MDVSTRYHHSCNVMPILRARAIYHDIEVSSVVSSRSFHVAVPDARSTYYHTRNNEPFHICTCLLPVVHDPVLFSDWLSLAPDT